MGIKMKKIRDLLNEIKHPEINKSLVELGMIGQIHQNDKLVVELKLPTEGIPIKEMLANLIKDKLSDFDVKVTFSVMNETEKQKFFELARKNWSL